jgi:hypothetical protein
LLLHSFPSSWARALQSLVSNDQFIGFLEGLTGIGDLIPMKVSEDELQWAGSNIIGITTGGFLLVHNDVSHSPWLPVDLTSIASSTPGTACIAESTSSSTSTKIGNQSGEISAPLQLS